MAARCSVAKVRGTRAGGRGRGHLPSNARVALRCRGVNANSQASGSLSSTNSWASEPSSASAAVRSSATWPRTRTRPSSWSWAPLSRLSEAWPTSRPSGWLCRYEAQRRDAVLPSHVHHLAGLAQNGLSYSLGTKSDELDAEGEEPPRKWVHNPIQDAVQWQHVKEATANLMSHYAHRVNGSVVRVYDSLVAFGTLRRPAVTALALHVPAAVHLTCLCPRCMRSV